MPHEPAPIDDRVYWCSGLLVALTLLAALHATAWWRVSVLRDRAIVTAAADR